MSALSVQGASGAHVCDGHGLSKIANVRYAEFSVKVGLSRTVSFACASYSSSGDVPCDSFRGR